MKIRTYTDPAREIPYLDKLIKYVPAPEEEWLKQEEN